MMKMKNIIAIGVLSMILVGCKSTSSTTSNTTKSSELKTTSTTESTLPNTNLQKMNTDDLKSIKVQQISKTSEKPNALTPVSANPDLKKSIPAKKINLDSDN